MHSLNIRELPDTHLRKDYSHYMRLVNQSNFRNDWKLTNKQINCLTLFLQLQNELSIKRYLQSEKENGTIFQMRRSTSPPSASHSSFVSYDHHTARTHRAKAYDWIKSRQIVDSLLLFAFIPERLYAIEAKIQFLSSTTDPSLLYDREINNTIRNAVLYLHLSPTELILYCSRIRNRAKAGERVSTALGPSS